MKKIDSMDKNIIGQIQSVKQSILNGDYKDGSAPNCFWLAMSFSDQVLLAQPEKMSGSSFLKFSKSNFYELNLADLRVNDMIYYEGVNEVTHDVINDGSPIAMMSPFHAGVYMGDNVILQKENDNDHIFSLVELNQSFRGYSNAIKDMKNGHLQFKALRSR